MRSRWPRCNRAHSLGLVRARAADPRTAVTLMGLQFPNRVGLAAGFDKNGRYIDALGALGFGFLEVGTVTPRPQPGQPRPRLFRVTEAGALINRMGFPNEGAAAVAARLAQRRFAGVCGVNIGKNAATPIDAAVDDYLECFRIVAPHADYVAINVSSPNTRRSAAAAGGRPVAADRQRAGRSAPTAAGCHGASGATAGEGIAGSRAGRPRAQRATGVRDRHRWDHRDQHDAEPQRDRAALALAGGWIERRAVAAACPAGGAVAAHSARCRRADRRGRRNRFGSPRAGCVRCGRRPRAGLHRPDLSRAGPGAGDALHCSRTCHFIGVSTPLSRATISTSAGRRANKPTVTTPTI